MDASEARNHLQWLDGILKFADQTLHLPPATLIAWGLVAATFNALHQAAVLGRAVPRDGLLQMPMILIAIGVSIWASSRNPPSRRTLADSSAGIVFLVVFAVILLLSLTAQDRVLSFHAMALFWSAGYTIALLVVGIQSSRPLWVGGLIMLAASTIASFVPGWFDGILALGWVFGFAGSGLVLALGKQHGRTSAV